MANPPAKEDSPAPARTHPRLMEAFWVWVKIGLLSFGGPSGQIALMHQELVEKRKWISDARFLHALNYCMVLPGPEAHQLAIYTGWLLHRALGGIIAGFWFVLPGAAVLLLVSYVYVTFGNLPILQAIFYGLKAAVVGIVAAAVIRIGRKALKNEVMWTISILAFVAIFWLKVPFPIIVISAGIIGLLGGKFFPSKFNIAMAHAGGGSHQIEEAVISDTQALPHTKPVFRRTVSTIGVCLLLWFAPLLMVWLWLGSGHTLFHEGLFFSKAAVVTFGGAYAVLPYVAQQAVETHGWLSTTQMMDGLGLAETTPGPLILVLQFVGFLGGWHGPGELSPIQAAMLGALLTSWMTFVPGFLFIFAGAPYIEQMRGNLRMTTALSAITAAVVGVILNLAVWFGLSVLFPQWRVDWFALLLSATAFIGLLKFKWDVIPVILGSALLGAIYKFILGG
jgi:chromate transporter